MILSFVAGVFVGAVCFGGAGLLFAGACLASALFGSRGKAVQQRLKLLSYRGKQFMYCRFLCSKTEKKHLLRASPFTWGLNYPKDADLKFSLSDSGGERRVLTEGGKLVASRFRARPADLVFG